jgi:hypothetical protein
MLVVLADLSLVMILFVVEENITYSLSPEPLVICCVTPCNSVVG